MSRVAITGEMAGSLAHELNQPLTGIVNNASAGRRFIAKGRADLLKLDSLFEAVVADGHRAGEIIRGIRGMVRKSEEVRDAVNLNDVIAASIYTSADAATFGAGPIRPAISPVLDVRVHEGRVDVRSQP